MKKYHQSNKYFGFTNSEELFTSERISKLPILKLYGLDGIYNYNTSDNYESFIETYSCPILLPYSDGKWIEDCLKDKITVISFLNKRRKGSWNAYGGQLKLYGIEYREKEDFNYQMLYVDAKQYPHVLDKYKIPLVPCVIIIDYRFNDIYYLGEYNLKIRKKFFKLLDNVYQRSLNIEEYTVDKLFFTKFFSIWQLLPLLFLLAGLIFAAYLCIKQTFKSKVKIN